MMTLFPTLIKPHLLIKRYRLSDPLSNTSTLTLLALPYVSFLYVRLQRKAGTDKGTAKPKPPKGSKKLDSLAAPGSESKRPKRPTKSVNENLEPTFTASLDPA